MRSTVVEPGAAMSTQRDISLNTISSFEGSGWTRLTMVRKPRVNRRRFILVLKEHGEFLKDRLV